VLGASLPFTACTGWWFEPLSKMMELVSWGYKIPSGKIKVMFQTTNQFTSFCENNWRGKKCRFLGLSVSFAMESTHLPSSHRGAGKIADESFISTSRHLKHSYIVQIC
jgi:hypothetical protein